MDSKELKGLFEAYTAVYDEDLRDELEEMSDQFTGIENLSEEEIDAIVEETIEEMLDDGYNFDEVEEIFEEVILEMNPYAPAGSKASKEYASKTSQAKRQKERAEKISQVKGAVKSALGRAKEAVGSGVEKAKEAGREAKFRAVDKPVAAYATKRKLHPAAGATARSKDPAKRRGLRSKVASDIKSRIGGKISRAVDRAKTAGAGVASAAMSAPSAAKSAVKSGVGKAARAVSRGARSVARKLGEETDAYDIVLEHLIENGYAESYEAAEKIMVNMSEEWRNDILSK